MSDAERQTKNLATPVQAAERDQLLAAAITFISTLTGMKPPPIEVAPQEVFAPFHEFVDQVQEIVRQSGGAPAAPAASSEPIAPVIYVDDTGKLVSRVSGEQVEAVLGPVVDEIRARMARQGTYPNRYAGEGPISALYGIRYVAGTLQEARTMASDAMDTWTAKPRVLGPAPDQKSNSVPREPLWDRKGNVIHAAVDRLGAAQRAAAAATADEPEDTPAETPKP